MEVFCPDLDSGVFGIEHRAPGQHWKPDLPTWHPMAPVPSLEHLAMNEWGPGGGPGLSNPPGVSPGY